MAHNLFPISSNNIVLLTLFLFISFESIYKPALCGSNVTDMQALLAFKSAIVVDPFHALKSWNQTAHHCSWRGVMCGHKHSQRVVHIDLTSQGLVGSLSPYIGNLSFLKILSLGNNSFGGQIPQEIGCLNRLEYLELTNNSFSGEIPRNISQCRNLYYLALMNNKLTGRVIPEIGSLDKLRALGLALNMLSGTIPPWIGNLTYLEKLSLANCGLEGQIPEEICRPRSLELINLNNNSLVGEIPRNLSNCRNLVALGLMNNNLVGSIVPEIGSLTRLQALGLSLNKLSGTIPPWVGNLTSLVLLQLQRCDLKGEIPVSLVHLRNLRVLDLAENKLTGNIPSELFNSSLVKLSVRSNQLQGTIPPHAGYTLPNIMIFDLGGNNLSGEIPTSLLNASSLEGINVGSNKFSGSIPNNFERLINLNEIFFSENSLHGDVSFISSLTNCTKLQKISVSGNFLSGLLPNSIANLSQEFSFLSMGGNRIHGILPSGIGDLLNLTHLVLSDNYFSGPIPSSISKLIKLQELLLGGNRFTGGIPSLLGNLVYLDRLYLGSNYFTGTIPQSFVNLRNLLILDLSNSSLKGALPREILSLSSISIYLGLANNAFTGPIPQEVGHLRNLGSLDLSNNQLSGSIPSAMSSCVSLEYLNLGGNSLEGEIPMGLSAVRALQDLDLSRNHLSGAIPSFLGEQLHLNHLNLSFNNFSGEVPTSGVFRNKSAISIEGNKDLCGGIPELRLPSCPNPNKGNTSRLFKIVVSVSVMGVICSITLFLICVIIYYKRNERGKNTTPMPSFDQHFLRLSYVDLQKSTGGFSEANLIGAGRFGCVYRGTLDDGKIAIAVKVLNLDVRGASKTLMAECNALKRIRHRNLIEILSVCLSSNFRGQDFKALVYEYKSNGSLEEWLHPNTNEQGIKMRHLTLIQRLNISIEVATALGYLHFGTDSTIIHGDLKPSNVLLDEDMIAHVADFGLAKVVMCMSKDLPIGESNSTVAIKGTIGYIAPEYGMGSMGSIQGDVYSFGILMLEMFTNIRPTDEAFKGGHSNLHSFVSRALPDAMVDILDWSIVQEIEMSDNHNAVETMQSVLKIGVACSNEFPRDRMAMTDAEAALDKIRSTYVSGNRYGLK